MSNRIPFVLMIAPGVVLALGLAHDIGMFSPPTEAEICAEIEDYRARMRNRSASNEALTEADFERYYELRDQLEDLENC